MNSNEDRDEEIGSLRKAKVENGNTLMEDLNVKAPKSCDVVRESPAIRLTDNKGGIAEGNDSEHDLEANFRHGGHKRSEIVTLRDIGVSLGDDLFEDVESCSMEPADEVTFLFLSTFNFPFVDTRVYYACLVYNLYLLFFSCDW